VQTIVEAFIERRRRSTAHLLVDPGGGVALHGAGPVNDDGRRRKVQDGLQSLPSFHRQLVVVGSISIWILVSSVRFFSRRDEKGNRA
jgi:hypothetical protein